LEKPRYDGLDAIRAGAMLLGLAYHATYAWLPNVGPWYFVADASPVEGLGTLTGLIHSFRMQVFFALSGFFSHLVFERRGARGFIVDRSKRLVLPFLVALPFVFALDVAVRSWSQSAGLMSPQFQDGARFLALPRHLWFLVYLFTFCVLAWVTPKWDGPSRWLRAALRLPLLPTVVLTALTCAGLWLHPSNRPDLALWPRPFEVFHFGLFYAVGWWLWPARDVLEPLRRQAPFFLIAGLALGLFIFRGALQYELTGQVLAGAVAWLMTMGAFGLAFRVKPGQRPWLRFLVESSYWVYLVHYPVVQALQVVFAQLQWPGLLEYGLATLLTFSIALFTFTVFVRRTPLGPWLGVRSRS
jgi:glucans biosynthesis protein C